MEMEAEYKERIRQKDEAYHICEKNMYDCSLQLSKTNSELKEKISLNIFMETEVKRLKSQRNYIILGSVCVTTGLLLLIFAK